MGPRVGGWVRPENRQLERLGGWGGGGWTLPPPPLKNRSALPPLLPEYPNCYPPTPAPPPIPPPIPPPKLLRQASKLSAGKLLSDALGMVSTKLLGHLQPSFIRYLLHTYGCTCSYP